MQLSKPLHRSHLSGLRHSDMRAVLNDRGSSVRHMSGKGFQTGQAGERVSRQPPQLERAVAAQVVPEIGHCPDNLIAADGGRQKSLRQVESELIDQPVYAPSGELPPLLGPGIVLMDEVLQISLRKRFPD